MTNEKGVRLALTEAEKALSENEVPIGAVLVKGDTVIASAHNLCRQTGDPTAHAELLALREGAITLGGPLSECTLYVTLEPCAMCAGAAVQTGLCSLVYGAFDDNEGCCGSLIDLTDHWMSGNVKTIGGILEEECSRLLSSFFKKMR